MDLEGGPLGMTVAAQKDTICKGETTVMTAFGFGGNEPYYTYTWYYDQQLVKQESNATSSLEMTGITPGPETFEVVIWDGYNADTVPITVEVMDSPVFHLTGGPDIIACPYDSVQLHPDQSYPDYAYYWSNGATENSITVGTTGIGFDQKTYHLTVTTPYGCQYTDSITVTFDFAACFGIGEYESFPSVKVYPNPTPGIFTVEFEDGEGFEELIILNSIGDVVQRMDLGSLGKGVNRLQVSLDRHTRGIYFLRAVNERFIYHQKVIRN